MRKKGRKKIARPFVPRWIDPLSSFPHGQCKYKCLKTMIVHNFMGTKSQVELMEHIVENAPVLEVLTVDPRRRHVPGIGQINETVLSATRRIATISIGGKLSARTRLIVLWERLYMQCYAEDLLTSKKKRIIRFVELKTVLFNVSYVVICCATRLSCSRATVLTLLDNNQ